MTPFTRLAMAALLPLWLAACVTINIYFPAAAAEKAADRIIEDVWGKEGKPPAGAPAKGEPVSLNRPAPAAFALLEWLVSPAHAAGADININTPGVAALRNSMRSRHASLEPYYASGAVGLTRDGLITVHDLNAAPLRERAGLNRLVAEENGDRNSLYREIAKANGHPEWETEIRATFARRWVDNAGRGWWYQDSAGAWRQR